MKIEFNPDKIRYLIKDAERNEKDFKKKDFLRKVGISAPAFDAIQDGRSVPKVTTLSAIADYFKKDINFFFNIDQNENPVESKVNFTGESQTLLKRFEELVVENSQLKARLENYTSSSREGYTLSNVQDSIAAEPATELNTDQTHPN